MANLLAPSGRSADSQFARQEDTFRVGAAGENRVAVLFHDTAERRREADASFLNLISKELARQNDPDEIMHTVGARLNEHLKLSGCRFVAVDEARGEVTIHHTRTAPDVPGRK